MLLTTQNICKILTLILFNVLYTTRYIDGKNIPKKGGVVICPNHTSYIDPPLIGSATFSRIFRFMARDTLFKSRFTGAVITWMGAFPVRRAAVDRKSWAMFVKLVQQGECVMLFPEGTRTEDGEIHEGKPGAGMLLYKAKALVVPVYTHGLFAAWPKGQKEPHLFKRITVKYGEPMDMADLYNLPESKEVYQQITDRVMERIRGLKQDVLAILAAKKK